MGKPNSKIMNRLLPALGLVLIAAAAVIFAFTDRSPATVTTFAMGSYVQQTVYGAHSQEAAAAGAAAVQEAENLLSWRVEGSDVFRINQLAGKDFTPIDPLTAQVLSTALDVCRASSGAFDVTIGPVSRLWDFDNDPHVPSDDQLREALPLVDFFTLSVLDGQAALRKPGAAIDLGAVGKGAACDAAVAAYQEAGLSRGIIAVGGSVGIYGEKPWKKPWVIAVRDPFSGGTLGELRLWEGFISTSGSYEKTFEADGQTYHHLLDPATGYPAKRDDLVSVTVVSGSGALSDALSTACFVLGWQESLPVLAQFDARAVFITQDGRVLVTADLAGSFALIADEYTLEVLP